MNKKSKKKKKSWFKIFKYFKNAKTSIIVISITMIISCIFGVLTPIITANILTSITEFNADKVIIFSLFLICVTVLDRINAYLCNISYLRGFKRKVLLNIRKDMVKNILDMKTINFDKHTSGEFAERLRTDPENISRVLSACQFSLFNIITDFLVLIYTFYINYVLGLIYSFGLIVILIYGKYAFEVQKKLTKTNRKLNDKNTTLLNEIMHGVRDIKFLNMTNPISKIINNSLDEVNSSDIEKGVKQSLIWDINEIIRTLTEALVLIVGVLLIKNNLLTVTNLIIIYMYRTNIFDIEWCYTTLKEYFTEFLVATDRVFELMNNTKYPKEKFGIKEIKDIKGKIECKKLSFKYKDKEILKNISFKINPNDTVGIVGASGSGKTTLLNLLIKSYYVGDFKIFIDDIDINSLSKDSIRNNISIITQNPYIFNLSIKENLELVTENISKEDMIEACKIAQIHDYIETLPKKYDTLIGEGGINLSGGQKQRLAIARALLKKSKIILMDEATSALDNITQNELQKAINNITKDYTIIIVAHRLSTIKECQRIYVLNDGKIVGVGTHEELLKDNIYYKKLYKEELI